MIENIPHLQEFPKTRTLMDFMDKTSLLLFPGKQEWRQRFCYTLQVWARKDTSLDMQQFMDEYNFPRRSVYEWIKKYKDIAEAWEDAKLTIASRMRVGALKKEYDKDVVYKNMHNMDADYLVVNKYWHDFKKVEDSQVNENVQFVIIPAKKTGKVKPKKTKELNAIENKE